MIKSVSALYLALIRSQFEHCSIIWRPTNKTMLQKLETLQKRCIKWILSEENISYHSYISYVKKCRQVDLLPLSSRFDLSDLLLFHKIVYELTPLKLPYYLTLYQGNSRLRSSHLDRLSVVSSIHPNFNITNAINENSYSSRNAFANSFSYRTHTKWNSLPFELRDMPHPLTFKKDLINYLWGSLVEQDSSEDEDLLDTG